MLKTTVGTTKTRIEGKRYTLLKGYWHFGCPRLTLPKRVLHYEGRGRRWKSTARKFN